MRAILHSGQWYNQVMMNTTNPSTPPDKPFVPFPEQNEDGVDLSLIRRNLRLSPTERVRQGDRARRGALRLRKYARRLR